MKSNKLTKPTKSTSKPAQKPLFKLPHTWWKWLILAGGALFIIVGVFLLLKPQIALTTSILLVGALLLAGGLFNLVVYFANRSQFGVSGWMLTEGIIATIIGILILFNPILTETALLFFIGVWFIIVGAIRLVNAMNMAYLGVRGWLWTTLFGLVLLFLGVFSFFSNVLLALAIAIILGLYFIISGVIAIIEFFMVDRVDHQHIKSLYKKKK